MAAAAGVAVIGSCSLVLFKYKKMNVSPRTLVGILGASALASAIPVLIARMRRLGNLLQYIINDVNSLIYKRFEQYKLCNTICVN